MRDRGRLEFSLTVQDAPLVTAVVVNFRGRDHLPECLASLFAQTWPRLEVILVDNGSDGEVEDAETRHGPALRVLRNERNEGFARANNQAFELAKGEWIFLLNNDAVADPDCVERLVRFAEGRPQVGMLACRVVQYHQPHFFDSAGLLLYPDGVCRPRGWEEKDLGQYDRAEEVLAPHGCAAAYRKAMLDDVGGFDEDYFAYLEDLDLGMRGWLLGWTGWYVPDARVRHKKSASAGNYSKFKAYHVERNRVWVVIKCFPLPLVAASIPWSLARYVVQAYGVLRGRGAAGRMAEGTSPWSIAALLLRAWRDALGWSPEMWRRRRRILAQRRVTWREVAGWFRSYPLSVRELALRE